MSEVDHDEEEDVSSCHHGRALGSWAAIEHELAARVTRMTLSGV
jgi:hypothetical protein